jgi:hypothetical protein
LLRVLGGSARARLVAALTTMLATSFLGCGAEAPVPSESTGTVTQAVVPAPWTNRDIGSVGVPGSAAESGGQFAVYGSGADISGTADAFQFVYQPMTGDTQIVAKVTSVLNTNPWAKAGVMIRESLNANSRHAFACLTPSNGVAFQSRSSTGGTSVNTNVTGIAAPYWVKLVRSGNQFSAFRSANGVNWSQVGSTRTISMSATVFVGLAATSHDNARLGSASFTNVSVPPSARSYQVDVLVMREIHTCAIGDRCTTQPCFNFQNISTGQNQVSFANNANFALVTPNDPRRQTAAQVLCLNLTIDPVEVSEIRTQLDAMRSYVLAQTANSLALTFVVHEVPAVDMTMQPSGLGIAMTPLDVKAAGILQGRLSANTGFILGIDGAGDFTQNLRTPLGGCGLSYGYQPPTGGAPYSWISKSGRAFGFECTNRDEALVHEWLHLVDIALKDASGFNDIYSNGYPACGMADPDPHKWFPDADTCSGDPDFAACGGACPGNEPWNRHILNTHWDAARPFFPNYCKNGRKDFDETAVDQGPSCL